MDFLERKPQLKEVLNNPYIWQEFVRKELLDNSILKDKSRVRNLVFIYKNLI